MGKHKVKDHVTENKEARSTEPYTLNIDGKVYRANLTDPGDMQAWSKVLEEQGEHELAERVARMKFTPSMLYRLKNAGSSFTEFMKDAMDKINPRKKDNESDKKKTTTLFIKTEEGEKYKIKVPKNFTIDDIKKGLKAVGAHDFAEKVHSMHEVSSTADDNAGEKEKYNQRTGETMS